MSDPSAPSYVPTTATAGGTAAAMLDQPVADVAPPHHHGHHHHHAQPTTATAGGTSVAMLNQGANYDGETGREAYPDVAPPSKIANVHPENDGVVESQQAATAPGSGSVVEADSETQKVPFKEQVNGYAKKIAGKVFRNQDEVEYGQAKLEGRASD